MLVIVSHQDLHDSMVVAWKTSTSAATRYSAGVALLVSTGYQDSPWPTAEVAEPELPA